jgi:hypothetical protein
MIGWRAEKGALSPSAKFKGSGLGEKRPLRCPSRCPLRPVPGSNPYKAPSIAQGNLKAVFSLLLIAPSRRRFANCRVDNSCLLCSRSVPVLTPCASIAQKSYRSAPTAAKTAFRAQFRHKTRKHLFCRYRSLPQSLSSQCCASRPLHTPPSLRPSSAPYDAYLSATPKTGATAESSVGLTPFRASNKGSPCPSTTTARSAIVTASAFRDCPHRPGFETPPRTQAPPRRPPPTLR